MEVVKALGVPHVMVFERKPNGGGMPDAAARQGVISIGGEYGGMGNVSQRGVTLVEQSVSRLLAYFGVTGTLPIDLPEPQVMHIFGPKAYVYAPEPGLFEPATELGDHVRSGDLCGHVLFPDNPIRTPIPVTFEAEGDVVCKRHPGRVERGDCVAHLAAPLST